MKKFLIILPLAASIFIINTTRAEGTKPVAPDNTGVNVRDAKNQTLTPMDQSNKPADRDMTQKIRQAVVDDASLSINAKNVKIITIDGKVTLRGPVDSAGEAEKIVAKATQIAGANNVNNQLEVASNQKKSKNQ